jgi:ESF2/ABP1 family protein
LIRRIQPECKIQRKEHGKTIFLRVRMETEPTEIEPVETTEEERHPRKKRKKGHLAPESEEDLRRRGIVYVSRLPPNMKPKHLRTLLSEWGVVTRVYCSLESTFLGAHLMFLGEEDWTKRKKRGGNRRRQFREAWVEFESKRKAYNAALALNGQKIGTRKKVCCPLQFFI